MQYDLFLILFILFFLTSLFIEKLFWNGLPQKMGNYLSQDGGHNHYYKRDSDTLGVDLDPTTL